mmetsp:Transcript_82483/g.237145  ORF Transcript_82483/g.237145 Transcript_82483/m.237145 type:complete len:203 (-) Transcript_82483:173-781(-)
MLVRATPSMWSLGRELELARRPCSILRTHHADRAHPACGIGAGWRRRFAVVPRPVQDYGRDWLLASVISPQHRLRGGGLLHRLRASSWQLLVKRRLLSAVVSCLPLRARAEARLRSPRGLTGAVCIRGRLQWQVLTILQWQVSTICRRRPGREGTAAQLLSASKVGTLAKSRRPRRDHPHSRLQVAAAQAHLRRDWRSVPGR